VCAVADTVWANPPAATPLVGGQAPIPVSADDLNTVILRPKRIAVIVPYSSELARNSAAEAVFN
jgi:hypothetical protein